VLRFRRQGQIVVHLRCANADRPISSNAFEQKLVPIVIHFSEITRARFPGTIMTTISSTSVNPRLRNGLSLIASTWLRQRRAHRLKNKGQDRTPDPNLPHLAGARRREPHSRTAVYADFMPAADLCLRNRDQHPPTETAPMTGGAVVEA
jgi:hypothetical protein